MKRLEKSKMITVASDAHQILLSTLVGNGNKGGGNVKLKSTGEVVAKGLLAKFLLGTGADVKGKTYIVTTNGLDINPFRDDIPITHTFTGPGVQNGEAKFLYPEESDGEFLAGTDGLVSYVIEYTFS